MTDTALGPLELTILLAVARLRDDAYGLAIRRDLAARTGRDHSVGAIYTTLGRLAAKGLVTSSLTEPMPVRGGRARKEFRLTGAGERALRAAARLTTRIWGGVGTTTNPKPA